MKKLFYKNRVLIINLLIALSITIFINISFFLHTGVGAPPPSKPWSPPRPENYVTIQLLYSYIFAFILSAIATYRKISFGRKIIYCLIFSIVFYFLTPIITREGDWSIMAFSHRLYSNMLITKTIFILVVALLYGKVFELTYQKQHIIIENQKLKNENLQTRYNMLANQISPHFLFNSLNSLSMLVREKCNDKALQYIDKMSDTFRYMLQSGQSEMTTLEDELKFTEAYMFLHTIRYENKLFFDTKINPKYMEWKLPSMSLQPLIENSVKHNSITLSKPFTITITTIGDSLCISNPIIPKIENTEGTKIGLSNLSLRYKLLTNKDITINNDTDNFTVILPLIKPDKEL